VSARRTSIVLLLVLALARPLAAAQEPLQLKGLGVNEALRLMQTKGLRIVFSSAVVAPHLRVAVEPRGATLRLQLDDLLAAHGLEARDGPGGIIQIVRAESRTKKPSTNPQGTSNPPDMPVARRHHEYISVTDSAPYRTDPGASAEMNLERVDASALRGTLAEDPFRVVQAFPRVAAVGDFGTDFVVRGSPFRQVNQVVDGVSTTLLQHATQSAAAAGSLSMVSGPVLDRITLRTGAYPRRNGDRLGPELELALREGSRAGFGLRVALGGSHAMLLAEGPLQSRGSWLIAARQSYLEWPPEGASSASPFGFSDGLAKVVFDAGRNQQVAFTALGGTSVADVEDDLVSDRRGAANSAAVYTLAWEARLRPALVITQRGYVVRQRLTPGNVGDPGGRGEHEQAGYRIDVSQRLAAGVLEAGAELGRRADLAATATDRAGYAHFAWRLAPKTTISPGVRITSSTLVRDPVVSPWLLGEWSFRRSWTLNVSTGVSHQLPPLRVRADRASAPLKPERAGQVDVGIEHRPTETIRWQATVFLRREADVLREPDVHWRLVDGALVAPTAPRVENALTGRSRGIELLVERRSGKGLSGWAAYSYGRATQTDPARAETYWSDFDQRHTLNLFGVYRFSPAVSVGATFRAGSNFPLPGYFEKRARGLSAGSARNEIRLPAYARLDLRAERRLHYLGRRLTPFVEVLNALDRTNIGRAEGRVNPLTGEAHGFTDVLLRRRMTAGIVVEF
jgi:hypothetical protein